MFAPTVISTRHWVGFIAFVLICLALDLGVFHKRAHIVKFREAFLWTTIWAVLALIFAWTLTFKLGREEAFEFLTGYVIELSLSMDNVFVIALIFGYFQIPLKYQHRVLFWGILGALVMRGTMIGVGTALISEAHWVLYLFAVFLIISGLKMVFTKDEGVHPEKNPLIRAARKFFPISTQLEGQRFTTRIDGRPAFTPLVLVLMMVETTDLVFALDSIPAIFAVTERPFIIFTSNVFAILGLRSLYFALAGAIAFFRYLKLGLSIILVFIGVKMLLAKWVPIPAENSLAVIGSIIFLAIAASVVAGWRERRQQRGANQ